MHAEPASSPAASSGATSASEAVRRGQAVYTPLILRVYDAWVLGFSNSLLWRCPTRRLLAHYAQHLRPHHLEAGVGTGYFLDRSRFASKPHITLLDLNENTLAFSSRRLRRLGPRTLRGNLLEPIAFSERYDSVALNYVLHCLPGDLDAKSVVFEHLKAGLREGGVIFGSTLLSRDVSMSRAARRLMAIYNRKGIFSNEGDSALGLEAALRRHFKRFTLEVVGCAALFAGYR
jgi:SAM-dependent methyltransferase